MAITVTTPTPGRLGFIANGVSADASGAEVVVAAPAAGSLVVDHLMLNVGANLTVTIGAGEADSAVVAALIGPLDMLAGNTLTFDFTDPFFGTGGMVLPATTALVVDTSGAGQVTVFVRGRVV